MLHPSISRAGVVLNGIYPNQFGTGNLQLPLTPFQAYQLDKLTIGYSESYTLRAFFSVQAVQSFKTIINDVPVSETSVLDKTTANVSASNGVVTYDGAGVNTSITLGTNDGKPVTGGVVLAMTDFTNCIPTGSITSPSFVLTLNQTKGRYMLVFSSTGSIVDLFKWENNSWVLVQGLSLGRLFTAADVVAFRVTPEKIEVLFNGTSVWSVARNWSVTLSSSDLGTLSSDGPYTLGQTVDLKTGTMAGPFTLSIANQDGADYKIDQPIEILSQTAPAETTPLTQNDLVLPVLAASLVQNKLTAATTPVAPAESTDWGKILTWGGIILAGVVALAGLAFAIRGRKKQ